MSNLVGRAAPAFTAQAAMSDGTINPNFSLDSYRNGGVAVVFFYPLNFTFVCPSEIVAFDKRVGDFAERGARLIGVSVDSVFSHVAWRNTSVNDGGIGQIRFPLVSDITKSISTSYGTLIEAEGVALRGTFLIDRAGKVRHQLVNDLPLGRNVDETLRTIDALQFYEENGEVCPAGWMKGRSGMRPTQQGVADYMRQNLDKL